jgi:tRNA(fMet)-specific endonuclease VapC
MVCLDTDFIIAYIRHDETAVSKVAQLRQDRKTLITVTAVTAMELYRGAYRSKNAAAEVAKVSAILETFDAILNLDHHSAKLAGEIDASLKLNPIEDSDLLIASIALANQETLLTRNTKHFERVQGLTVESW